MSKVEQHVQGWLRHRSVLLDLLEMVDEEYVSFKPTETSMPLNKLAVHIATSGDMFVQAVKNGAFTRPDAPEVPETMAEVRALVQSITDRNKEEMSAFTEDTLNGLVSAKEVFGFDAPGSAFLSSMLEHEVHHKGQLFVYVRMTGKTELPFFVKMK